MKKQLKKQNTKNFEEVRLYGACESVCSCPPASVPNSPQLHSANHSYNHWQESSR